MPKVDKDRYGPWAVISGGSEGSGAEFARALAASGINPFLIARNESAMDALAEDLRSTFQVEVRTLTLDLSQDHAVDEIQTATQDLEVGFFVSNAGAYWDGKPFLDSPIEAWQALINRNVRTLTATCHLFAGPMRARRRGGLVFMASGAGLGGARGISVYSATKGFELNLAESLWSELRESGVDVLGVAAPGMSTPAMMRVVKAVNAVPPPLHEPAEVVRQILEKLIEGPMLAFAGGADDPEAVMATRRDRVLRVENRSAQFLRKREG